MDSAQPSSSPRLDVDAVLADIRQLQHRRESRDSRGIHFIEGVRNFVQAVDHGVEIRQLIVSKALLRVGLAQKLVRRARRRGAPCLFVTPEQFRQVSMLSRASGIGAIVRQHWGRLHDVRPRGGLCWLAVTRVRSPGNLGSLLRTSAAVGGAGLIVISRATDPFDPAVVRGSMGTIFQQRIVRCGHNAFTHWVQRHHCQVVGASPDAEQPFHRTRYRRPMVLLLGEERRGLSPAQRALCGTTVHIPMAAGVDSLNLAVAGGLMLYEIFRTRGPRAREPAAGGSLASDGVAG
ncbi:MAG: RNA methyltransferase [Acidobacteriota bacterium]